MGCLVCPPACRPGLPSISKEWPRPVIDEIRGGEGNVTWPSDGMDPQEPMSREPAGLDLRVEAVVGPPGRLDIHTLMSAPMAEPGKQGWSFQANHGEDCRVGGCPRPGTSSDRSARTRTQV